MISNVSRTVGDAATVSSLAKNTKANSLRTAKAVAVYGKVAGHPLCLVALELWRLDAELNELAKDIVFFEGVLKQKEQAQALIEQFRRERKEKETTEASVLLREIDKLLPRAKTRYRAAAELWLKLYELREIAVARFERERENAKGDTKANKALQQVRKRWEAIANGASLKDGQRRKLGTLKILQDKVIKATWAKDGAAAGYWEAATGGDRLLADEVWQGRLTAQELRSLLEATDGACVAGDRDENEIRRVQRKLGIRPAEDQRGRKWKPPCPAKQKPKKPRGRPRIRPSIRWSEVVLLGADTTPIEAAQARRLMCAGGFDVEIESVPDKEKTTEYSLFEDADALGTGKTWTVKIYSNPELWVVKHE